PDVLPAVHFGIHGHAAPLPRLSRGIPGPARALHRRRFRTGSGLSHADGLFHLVAEIWRHGAGQSLGRFRPRVEDPIAAAAAQFRRDADRYPGSLRLQFRDRGGDPSWLATLTFTLTKKLSRCAS